MGLRTGHDRISGAGPRTFPSVFLSLSVRKPRSCGVPLCSSSSSRQSEGCTTSSTTSSTSFERIEVANPIVALGKFNALHLGHRELLLQASRMGHPCLLSFSGMSKILNLPARPSLTAAPDRPRVLASWSAAMEHERSPVEITLPFHQVRYLQPEDFVKVLVHEMGARGIVCGENCRFGYKAVGDASLLQELGKKHGIPVTVVQLVQATGGGGEGETRGATEGAQGTIDASISSSRITELVSEGEMELAAKMLGRPYRLVADLSLAEAFDWEEGEEGAGERQGERERRLSISLASFLNTVPGPGRYGVSLSLQGEEEEDPGRTWKGEARVGQEQGDSGVAVAMERETGQDLATSLEGNHLLCIDFVT